jgi:hypothetical protein
VADDLFGQPHHLDQLVEIDPGVDAHVFEHVHQVLGGDHHGRAAVAAVGAAGEAADRGLQAQRVAAVQHTQRRVDRGQGHASAIVQVEIELLDRRPARLDLGQRALSLRPVSESASRSRTLS